MASEEKAREFANRDWYGTWLGPLPVERFKETKELIHDIRMKCDHDIPPTKPIPLMPLTFKTKPGIAAMASPDHDRGYRSM